MQLVRRTQRCVSCHHFEIQQWLFSVDSAAGNTGTLIIPIFCTYIMEYHVNSMVHEYGNHLVSCILKYYRHKTARRVKSRVNNLENVAKKTKA